MNDQNATLYARFIENRDIIRQAFPWESTYLYPVCASIFTDKGILADPTTLRACKEMLNNKTGVFSNFRGMGRLPILCTFAADPDPQGRMERALKTHEILRKTFSPSSFLPLAAVFLSEMTEEYRWEQTALRARELYKRMRKEHPFLTSTEDTVFCILLALSYRSDDSLMEEAETCYRILKEEFHSANSLQSLTHVLTLSEGAAENKCRRISDLWQELENRGRRCNPLYTLPTLGVVAMLGEEIPALCDQLIEADNFLKNQKGYGFWGLDKNHRMLHAGMLVTARYGPSNVTNAAAVNSALSAIAAQQAAMCAVIAAASSASN